jgi:oligoendopeptidase F
MTPSQASTPTGAEDVEWNLGDLYASPDDPALERDLAGAVAAAGAFRERFAGRVATLSAGELAEATRELERLLAQLQLPKVFVELRFDADSTDDERGRLLQHVREHETRVETAVKFFELEWAAVSTEDAERKLADPAVDTYRHFLRSRRRFRTHLLSEPEERIAAEKALTGASAWTRLYGDLLSQIRVRIDGEEISPDEVRARLSLVADREERHRLGEALGEALEPGARLRAFVLNTILAERATEDRLRGYPSWLSSRNLQNDIPDDAVDALVTATIERYDVAQRHFRLRARLLDLPRLTNHDLAAPIFGLPPPLRWDAAAALAVEAFSAFSPLAGERVRRFFAEGWIDAGPRPGKAVGAYCRMRVPGIHPYILMNYAGSRGSALTLAHELGHGLHASLQEKLGYLNTEIGLTLVEVPSVFAEALAYDELFDRADDAHERLDLLVTRLDDAIATVFLQVAYNRFEDAMHTARRSAGELSVGRLSDLFSAEVGRMGGDALELTPGHRLRWSIVPHFALFPGYVYAYAFGFLVSLAVYQRYREEGESFVEPILDLLRAGGSRPPTELLAELGFNVGDPAFWRGGLDAIEAWVEEAETVYADSKKSGNECGSSGRAGMTGHA